MNSEPQIQAYLESLGVRGPAGQFIGRVSNFYHEAESAYYDQIHPELHDALAVWRASLTTITPELPDRIEVLDVGAGTGFATAAVVGALAPRIARVVCLDPSRAMLEQARRRLAGVTPAPVFVVGDIGCLDDSAPRFDLIVTNSVLHHLPDIQTFLGSIRRLLRPRGFYVAGHEPSRDFFECPAVHRWTSVYRQWRRVRRLGSPAYWRRRSARGASTDLEAATNAALVRVGLIDRPLPPGVVRQMIDIHVPGAPGFGLGLGLGLPGLSRDDILSGELRGFQCRVSTSYSHIKDSRARMGPVWRVIDRWLARRYPMSGSNFLIAAQQPAEAAQTERRGR